MLKKIAIIAGVGGGLVVTGVLLVRGLSYVLARRDDEQARRMYILLRHDASSGSVGLPSAGTALHDNISVGRMAANRLRNRNFH